MNEDFGQKWVSWKTRQPFGPKYQNVKSQISFTYTPVNEDIGQQQLFGPHSQKIKSSNSLLMGLVDTNVAQK